MIAFPTLLPKGAGKQLRLDHSLPLDCGISLPQITIAYQSYGQLNGAKSNAILICHPLTADQFFAHDHPVTGKPGWWAALIGPGKLIDTDKYFVLCANVLGGCMGTTGPSSVDPKTGQPYALTFPVVTIADMVRAQVALIDALGIDMLHGVIGGSMGGMQALEWAASHGERVYAAAPIATAAHQTPQNIAFHEVGRQAVMADPNWCEGNYALFEERPVKGLAVARMAAHVTYLSEQALNRKFGRDLQDRDAASFSFAADFTIESYLRHQGKSFVDRFDANSYLYITRAMDYFDLAEGGPLATKFRDTKTRFLLASFSSDWLYPTQESKQIVRALHGAGADVSFTEIESDKGHDAFLLDEPEFFDVLRGFITAIGTARGLL